MHYRHTGGAILVWGRLKQVAYETQRTGYQVKYGLLDDYLRQQLKATTVQNVSCVSPESVSTPLPETLSLVLPRRCDTSP